MSMYNKTRGTSISHSNLKHFLRKLGLKSPKSDLEDAMLDLAKTLAELYNGGNPDKLIVSPVEFESLQKILKQP